MEVAWKQLRAINFTTNRAEAVFELLNGDKLTGRMALGQLQLATAFGAQAVPLEHIRSLRVISGGTFPDGLRRELVLYFGFDRDEDPIRDQGGKENNAANHGSTWTPNGKRGGGRKFVRERENFLDCGNILGGHARLTISLWLRTSFQGPRQYVLGKYNGGGGEAEDAFLIRLHEQHPEFQFAFGGEVPGKWASFVNERGIELADGQWHHYAVVLDAASGVHVAYVDGRREALFEKPIRALNKGTRNFLVGASEENGQPAHFFDGTLDEIMIYERALTAEEIRQLFESQR
jgi:hypothetical protein